MPKIWEGVAGSPVTPVADFTLETRALLDEQIAARTTDFIARNAETGRPFFIYVCFTQMHPPLIHHPELPASLDASVFSSLVSLVELGFRRSPRGGTSAGASRANVSLSVGLRTGFRDAGRGVPLALTRPG